MKKTLIIITGIALIIISIILVTSQLKNNLRTEYDDVLDEAYLKPLPEYIGNGIWLNKIDLNDKVITYYFGVINTEGQDIDNFNRSETYELKEILKEGMISDIRKHPKKNSFVNEKIEFKCQFEGKDKINIIKFNVLPNEYR